MDLPYRVKSALDREDLDSEEPSGEIQSEADNNLYSFQGPLREINHGAESASSSGNSVSKETSFLESSSSSQKRGMNNVLVVLVVNLFDAFLFRVGLYKTRFFDVPVWLCFLCVLHIFH